MSPQIYTTISKYVKTKYLVTLLLLVALIFNYQGTNLFELPKLTFLKIFLALSLVGIIVNIFRNGKLKLLWNRNLAIFLGFWLLSLLISTVFSVAPELSFWGSYDRLQGLSSQLVYLAFFLIFLNVYQEKQSQHIFLKALVFVASLTSVHAILQQFGIGIFSEHTMEVFLNRSFATFGHPNFLGQFLIFPIWISIYFLINSKKKAKIPYLLSTVLTITALFFTENRASMLGLLAGAVIYILFTSNLKKSVKAITSVALLAGFAGFVALIAPSLRSLTTRLYLWEGSLLTFLDRPFFGHGLETFRQVFQKHTSSKFFELEQLYSIADRAHNEWLDLLVTQGIFGTLIYAVIIFTLFYLIFFRSNLRENRLLAFLGTALISTLVANFFGFPLVTHQLLFAALIAFILNHILKFKTIKLRLNLPLIFASGAAFALSLLLIFSSLKIYAADKILFEGTGKIYSHQIEEGLNDIALATNINPHQAQFYFQLADILFVIGRSSEDDSADKEILKYSNEILDYAGEFTNEGFRYHFAKGRNYAYMGDFENSLVHYQKAVELAPINPIVKKEMAVMYYLKGDYQNSVKEFENFLSQIPPYWKWKNQLELHSEQERESYRLFLKHVPDFWDIFGYLTESYRKIGNEQKAEYYSRFIEKEEDQKEDIQ